MKYIGMPIGMWMLFRKSFERNLITGFGLDRNTAKTVVAKAKSRYKEIIAGLPETTGIFGFLKANGFTVRGREVYGGALALTYAEAKVVKG